MVASLVGCGGGSSGSATSPTSPGTTQGAPAAPKQASFNVIDFATGGIRVFWLGVAGAERYLVEVGSSSGASDIETVNAPPGVGATYATVSNVAPREGIFIRVKAVNAGGTSAPSNELRIDMPDIRDAIEALFFASGPYGEVSRNPAARMRGWTTPGISVRVPPEVEGERLDAVVATVNDLNAATGLNFFIERVAMNLADYNRLRPAGVTYILGEGLCTRSPGGPADVPCSVPSTSDPAYRSVSIRITAGEVDKTWAHELGHAAAGLSHFFLRTRMIDPNGFGSINGLFGPQVPVMGSLLVATDIGDFGPGQAIKRFTAFELEAIRRVYSSGLRPGSSPADFVARGLIRP
jgi:hypothetical protein